MNQRIPVEQVSAKIPTEAERKARELTHVPYAPWCPSRIKHRARPDQRRRTGKSHPTISFDFCKVKARGSGAFGEEEEDAAQEGVQDDESGALLMVAVCSETGSLLGLPLMSKNQMNLSSLRSPRSWGMRQSSTTVTMSQQPGRLYVFWCPQEQLWG